MIVSFILSLLSKPSRLFRARFMWSPALDLSDPTVRSALLPASTT